MEEHALILFVATGEERTGVFRSGLAAWPRRPSRGLPYQQPQDVKFATRAAWTHSLLAVPEQHYTRRWLAVRVQVAFVWGLDLDKAVWTWYGRESQKGHGPAAIVHRRIQSANIATTGSSERGGVVGEVGPSAHPNIQIS